MKHILEFDSFEDRDLLKLHMNGPEATWLLENILQKLRYDLKHRDEVYDIKANDYIEELQTHIIDEIEDRQILID